LSKVGIDNSFRFQLGKDKEKEFSALNESLPGYRFSTRQFYYGFTAPTVTINAYFPNPNLVLLQKMKWLLVSSLVLIGITIACFIFTVKTMLSQSQLATLKDTFVNNMTHELKTPVATISIAAEAIQSFNLNAVSADEYLSIIRHQANKLTTRIDQILKSLLNEQAKLSLNREKINFKEVLDNCIRQSQPQLQSCHAMFSSHYPDRALYVSGDAVHLSNVMTNLLDNAIKYGSLKPTIELNIGVQGDNMKIELKNDGPGIPVEYQEKVFERFFRVPTGNTHNIKGYGLGLTYAYEVIRLHGGTINLKSNTAATTFIISLPVLTYEIAENIIA
jgi:signal transduction histidine kinase